jgi:hypothetical protein
MKAIADIADRVTSEEEARAWLDKRGEPDMLKARYRYGCA